MIRLTKEQVILIHEQLIESTGGSKGIRDAGMLESALETPFQTFAGLDLYVSLTEKAVRLGYGLIMNHPMVDGNKRLGTHAMLLTLELNGVQLEYTQEELYTIILNIASGDRKYEDLLHWVESHMK